MSSKRTRFAVRGNHPLLLLFTTHLIHSGFYCTEEDPDFILVGGEDSWPKPTNVPVLLLSGDLMYSDRDFDFNLREATPMKEDDPIFIPASQAMLTPRLLQLLSAEHQFLTSSAPAMVLRIFGVFGPDIHSGLVHKLIESAKQGEPLGIYTPGYHVRTYLHQTDLLVVFDRMLRAFLAGTQGLYNIGATEEVSMKRLAESCWQAHQSGPVQLKDLPAPRDHRWWVVPDLTRTKAVANWKPSISLRSGIWQS